MIAIEIDETTQAGQSILRELAQHPEAGKMKEFVVPCDENGDPAGAPWEEVLENIYEDLSEHYGVDFAKVSRMVDSGEMREDEVTNDLLLSPEFRYEPYPGFTPLSLPSGFEPDLHWLAAISSR